MESLLLFFATTLLALQVVCAAPETFRQWAERESEEFEKNFSQGLNYQFNSSIRLIGYKKVNIPREQLVNFAHHYELNLVNRTDLDLHHTYLDRQASTLRVYFPVAGALIQHGNKLHEASHLGELELDPDEFRGGAGCAILGRKQTTHITGVEGNIIKNGIIYLADAVQPERRYDDRVYVYDMGVKVIHGHDLHHNNTSTTKREEDENKSCVKNHGGKNCSDRFGIHHGRCPFKKNRCMDYNGSHTNCKTKGWWDSHKNFIGSDCYTSMSRGHCWNELMNQPILPTWFACGI